MKKAPFVLALAALFALAACDPNAPPRTVETDTPAWANQIEVVSAGKYFTGVRVNDGEPQIISGANTPLGNGLNAKTAYFKLLATDATGATCKWDLGTFKECTRPNPAYAEYKALKNATQP